MTVGKHIAALLLAVTALMPVSAQGTENKGGSLKRLMRLPPFERNIYREYISFRKWRGRTVKSIGTRRKVEYLLLFEP